MRRQEVVQQVAGQIIRKYRSNYAKARMKGREQNKAEEEWNQSTRLVQHWG